TRPRIRPDRAESGRLRQRAHRHHRCGTRQAAPEQVRGRQAMKPPAQHSLAALAERFDLELRGDGERRIAGVGTLGGAGPEQLSFLSNPHYRAQLADSRAAAVVLRASDAEAHRGNSLIAGDPYVAFAKIAALFDGTSAFSPGIHPST